MNVQPTHTAIEPTVWEHPRMREALAVRDIAAVFALLTARGVSQHRIARLTGQHQSEISTILGGRAVQSYDVLARIADGLGVPRGYLGLAYSDDLSSGLAARDHTTVRHKDITDDMERRTFLGLVSKLVVGASLTAAEIDMLAVSPAPAPPPRRVGRTDITQVQTLTDALRAYDASHGGGSCRDAILAHLHWTESLLNASCATTVRRDLVHAVADLKTLAGWAAHDLGLAGEARRYLAQAVNDTRSIDDTAHTAIVMHHLGRVPLDNGQPTDALKIFQLGQIAAQDSRSATVLALLHADAALAYAQLNDPPKPSPPYDAPKTNTPTPATNPRTTSPSSTPEHSRPTPPASTAPSAFTTHDNASTPSPASTPPSPNNQKPAHANAPST